MVTTTSACCASSALRRCGRRSPRSMPTSCMASTTCAWTRPAGSASLPAEIARCRPAAACSNSAWLIWERPALCRQTNRTVAIGLLRDVGTYGLLAADDLVGERSEWRGDQRTDEVDPEVL